MRSRQLRSNIQRALGDEAGLGIGLSSRIYDTLNRIQRRIAEDALAIETVGTISLLAGTETYAFPTGFITERLLRVQDSTLELEKINMDRVEELKRLGSSTGDQVLYYYKWNDSFGFLTSSGSAPSAAATVDVYYWRTPAELISDTIDPIINSRWDTCLFYGAVAELSSENKWYILYENEFNRVRQRETMGRAESYSIPVTRSYD